jgi:hypothetical protein
VRRCGPPFWTRVAGVSAHLFGSLELICPEIVTKFPAWLESLPAGDLEFLSPDFAPFRHALAGTRFENAPVRQTPRSLATAVGVIAARRFIAGSSEDPATVDANTFGAQRSCLEGPVGH